MVPAVLHGGILTLVSAFCFDIKFNVQRVACDLRRAGLHLFAVFAWWIPSVVWHLWLGSGMTSSLRNVHVPVLIKGFSGGTFLHVCTVKRLCFVIAVAC